MSASSIAGGDAPLDQITEAAFDRISTVNLRGAIMACKHVLPVMRAQRAGNIIMISSVAAWEMYPNVAYKATKAAMVAFTQQVAIQNAEFGVRANVILPGLMDTPMAVDTRARATGKSRAEVAAGRDARVPLRHKMGTAWDVANAALFLASDEANFITGVALPVDLGLGVMTLTPVRIMSGQSWMPLGLPLRTRKTIVDVYGVALFGSLASHPGLMACDLSTMASISEATPSVTTSACRPSMTERACFPEPPCDCSMLTVCPVFCFQSSEKAWLNC